MIDLKGLLQTAVDQKASDIHIKVGSVPHIRIRGELTPLEPSQPVKKEEVLDLAQHLLSNRQKEILAKKSELDLSFGGGTLGRFRLAVFQQRGALSMVFRLIPDVIPCVEELNLPEVLQDISAESRGLILVTGTTGSGKSTTLASMIDHINNTRSAHIITIEDPIEFLFHDKLAFISQREVAVDTETFSTALRSALRQDPDVILVGEMRDLETVGTAMQAAETGHLVMSTLHTTDALGTVNRVISMFPAHEQRETRLQLANVLQAVISLRLIRSSVTNGRIPAVEILRNTEFIRSLIAQPERTNEIRRALEAGTSQYRTQTFDQSILGLYRKGLITYTDALQNATSPEDLKLKIKGVVSSAEAL
jgi:twitching motility protein PilT